MKNKVIWIKKPKCAGTSIENLLRDKGCIYYVDQYTTQADLNAPENQVICVRAGTTGRMCIHKTREGQYLERPPSGGMEFFHKLLGHGFMPLHDMARRFPDFLQAHPKFSVIRNPYDKFVSSWRYLKKYRDLPAANVLDNLPGRGKDFHDWHHLTRTQQDCISDASGRTWLDFAVYMELDIEQDFARILHYLDIPYTPIPHKNKSERQAVSESLTLEEAQQVARVYGVDFTGFGYSKDISQLQPTSPLPQWNL
ncbi:MAG: sulfotransferase family 2 domain-containing protein [Pseudomonadota bacterium]